MARPGIMLYFDMLEPIRVLPDAEKGRLLVAMLEYGQSGKVPAFEGMLALAWAFVRPKLDRDGETYENAKLQRKYAAFCRQRAARELPKIPFEAWLDGNQGSGAADDEPERPVGSRYPSAAPSETADTTTDTATATAAAAAEGTAAAAAESTVNVIGGKLGKNVVFLSQAQMEDMLDRMGLEAFDYYVDKLSSFIIKNDAHVKNHYETMLRWWQEDGRRVDAERRR